MHATSMSRSTSPCTGAISAALEQHLSTSVRTLPDAAMQLQGRRRRRKTPSCQGGCCFGSRLEEPGGLASLVAQRIHIDRFNSLANCCFVVWRSNPTRTRAKSSRAGHSFWARIGDPRKMQQSTLPGSRIGSIFAKPRATVRRGVPGCRQGGLHAAWRAAHTFVSPALPPGTALKIRPSRSIPTSSAGIGFWHSDNGLSQKFEPGSISNRLRPLAPRQVSDSFR